MSAAAVDGLVTRVFETERVRHSLLIELARLIGMFAFAICDRVVCSLHVARDRFGARPLLIHDAGGIGTCASKAQRLRLMTR